MYAYGLGKFKTLSELQLHASRSSLSRFPSGTQKHDAQKHTTYVSSKAALSRKNTWRGLTKFFGSPNPLSGSAHGGTNGGALGSGTLSHGLSTHGQKRKLPPHEQKKKVSWIIKAKQ